MKRLTHYSILVAIGLLSIVIANAQGDSNTTGRYEKDSLTFDYPAGWKLEESIKQGVQTVTLSPASSATQIVVSIDDRSVPSCDFKAEEKKIVDALREKVSAEIKVRAGTPVSPVTTQIGSSEVEGTQLSGVLNRKPTIADVYSFRLNRHFVSLMYLRADNDESGTIAWNTIRSTLKVDPPLNGVLVMTTSSTTQPTVTSGVLNGRALRLPYPNYPPIARRAHASGVVTVQITIDESGNVASASAIEGNPLLRAVSVAAAREAQFSPTKLCGEPVRVTGVITYNFAAP